MPPKSKGRTSQIPLRMRPEERAIVERLQAWGAAAGLSPSPSLNDVLCHLIRRAELPVSRTVSEGMAAIQAHAESCEDCEPYRPPRCLDGVYLRELNQRAACTGASATGSDTL
jgi:hypothetical protein